MPLTTKFTSYTKASKSEHWISTIHNEIQALALTKHGRIN